jgi:hypothetical protein
MHRQCTSQEMEWKMIRDVLFKGQALEAEGLRCEEYGDTADAEGAREP